MTTKLAMDTGNFSYLSPDLFGIFRHSHRLQCTHCARCDFQNLLKNIRLYDPKNLRNALLCNCSCDLNRSPLWIMLPPLPSMIRPLVVSLSP